MNYKITKADLIGEIADFPIEVVEKMIEHQVGQGNVADVSVFQLNAAADVSQDGFRWSSTREEAKFWYEIIHNKKFGVFFAKYPMRNHHVYIYQDGTKKGSDIIKALEKRGGSNAGICGRELRAYYYINPITKSIGCCDNCDELLHWLKTFYTEIDVEPSIKEYTMQEIADKLGIDVANLRIKK